jgi:hypothetical protein
MRFIEILKGMVIDNVGLTGLSSIVIKPESDINPV